MNDGDTIEPEQRSLSPWAIIGGIIVVAMVGALGLGFFAAAVLPAPSPVPQGLAQATLSDDSVLVVHDLAEGSTQLNLAVPSNSLWQQLLGLDGQTHTFHASSSSDNQLNLWLARYDGETGKPLPFDRWAYSIVRTADGREVWDSPYASRMTRKEVPHSSTSSASSSRPFSPLDPGPYTHIVYASGLPRFRQSGSHVEVDIYHADDGLVATIQLPFADTSGSEPRWTPEPLPATVSDGNIEVTLTSITSEWLDRPNSPEAVSRPHQRVHIKTSVREDGEESALWSHQQITLTDALDNRSYPYDCNLSPREPAWQVLTKLYLNDEAALTRGPRLVVEDIELPDADPATTPNFVQPGDTTVLNGVTVSLLGVGGPGESSYRFKTRRTSRGTHSAGEGLQTEYRPPNAELRIDRSDWHIALHVLDETADHRLSVIVTDQSGVRLDLGYGHHMDEARVWTFERADGMSTANLYVTVQQARLAEFTVAPPQTE